MTDAVLEDKFKEIRKSEEKLDVCYKIADLFCLVQESKDEKIWNLLLSTFNNLNEFEQIDLIYFHFLWNFLSILGYAPQLHNCALCSEKLLPETLFFSPTEGGVCCWRCNVEEKKEITVGAIQVIRLFLKEKQTILNKLRVINVDKESLEEVSLFYFSFLRDAINPQK